MRFFYLILLCLPFLSRAAAPPNIILMMGDDHGWEETGYNGHPHVKTPGARRDGRHRAAVRPLLRRASELLAHARAVSSPDAIRTAWARSPPAGRCGRRRSPSRTSSAKAGYRCGHFGKWHVGAVKKESPTSPGAMGFHEWVSHDNFFELNPSLSRNGGPPEVFKGESSEIVIAEAIRFIDARESTGKPLLRRRLVRLAARALQRPARRPRALRRPAREIHDKQVKLTSNETGGQATRPQGEVLRERYAEITAMDRAIGTLRKHLAAHGLRENTLLFYCGDNGTSADAALGFPHRGVKGQVYEGGTLVPGLIEWPARIPKPRTTGVPRQHQRPAAHALRHSTGQPLPDASARRHRSHARARRQNDRAPHAALFLGNTTPSASPSVKARALHRSRAADRAPRRW